MRFSKLLHLALLLPAVVLLAGCEKAALSSSTFFNTAAFDIFQKKDVNLKEKNYAAADYLIQQGSNFVSKKSLIKATPMFESQEPQTPAPIGSMIPEQVGVRLSQLGYRVDLADVLSSSDTNYLKPATSAGEAPDVYLSGTYLRRRLDMDVSLRLTEIRTGRVVAAFDYTIPMNREIAELSKPQTQIFKVQE